MGAVETKLRIMNDTNSDIIKVIAWGLDAFRWVTPYRPDLQFAHSKITSKFCKEKELKLNPNGSLCFFNMTLKFSDGTEDCFKINQKFAVGETSHFEYINKTHIIEYEREEDATLVITLKNTYEQLVDKKISTLTEDGIFFTESEQFNKAFDSWNIALGLVQDKEVKRELTRYKINTLKKAADHLYQRASQPENHVKITKAELLLIDAKNHIIQARSLDPTPELKETLNRIDNKLQEMSLKHIG